ncbi:HAD family phosphatase [Candidatus Woesearchaeota archaeon]|nr:HAD family phosphatase [Candidatus Woesearchaeota archaeon]
MIKAVIFDWGGVVIDSPAEALFQYCADHLNAPKKEFKKTYMKYEPDIFRGVLSEKQTWEKICQELGVKEPTVGSLWYDAVKNAVKEKKEVTLLINNLKKSGYKVGFLSNTEIPATRFFKKQDYPVFDAYVFSCFEGIIKPERKIYELALNRLGVKPEESIFIDDREENVEGAKRVGMHAIVFKDIEQLKKELESFSVKTE